MRQVRSNVKSMAEVRTALSQFGRLVPTDWRTYDVAWTIATGSAPAIGNGVLEAYFMRNAAMCFLSLLLVAGGTTTFGSTNDWWYFSLPVAAAAGGLVHVYGSGCVDDASTNTTYGAFPDVAPDAEAFSIRTTGGVVKKDGPMAVWASGDAIRVSLLYPCANA